jgi:GNAT superfamily N-acetyltransferase
MNKLFEPYRILMTRQSLQGFPVFPVPAGFTLRWYEPGFEEHWLAIHLAAEKEIPITPDLFSRRFGSDPTLLAARQCYLFSMDGSPVGTITGWLDPLFEGQSHARVHFLAVVPQWQGRGLAKVLMSSVLQRLKELGHTRTYLATSSNRIHAVRLYLRFGFVPLAKTGEAQALWQEILRAIELDPRNSISRPRSFPAGG